MKSVSLNGTEIAFEDVGSGSQALLLVHGHPFDRTMWRPQLEPIARLGWRLIVPDLRGYGASAGGGDKTTLDVFARDLNNAGLALGMGRAHEASLADWDRMIDTNCRGLTYVTRALLPGMVARGRGLIVNIGSAAGTYPYPGGNVYGATKAFVHQFSLNLRSDLHGTGVRVTCIEPGMCGGTEFSATRLGGDLAGAAKVYAGMQPLAAEDIADTVAWIASRPPHVNINMIELMPVVQSLAGFQVHRLANQ